MHKFIGLLLLAAIIFGGFLIYRFSPKLLFNFKEPAEPPFKSQLQEAPSAYEPASQPSFIEEESAAPKIKISSVSPKSFFQSYSQVVLTANLPKGERLNVTGWKIKSNKDYWVIPRGAELYSAANDNIYVKEGDRVNIYSHGNSLNTNFRLNKCIGYIQGLDPENPKNCPYIDRSEISGFSGLCQDYISSLGSCQVPESNPPVPVNDAGCRAFLSKLNYAGCVNEHRNDKDFFDGEWRIWMTGYGNQESDIFDPSHDRIKLIDGNGRPVDEYVY